MGQKHSGVGQGLVLSEAPKEATKVHLPLADDEWKVIEKVLKKKISNADELIEAMSAMNSRIKPQSLGILKPFFHKAEEDEEAEKENKEKETDKKKKKKKEGTGKEKEKGKDEKKVYEWLTKEESQEFFEEILPEIQKQALKLPTLFDKEATIPLLKQNQPGSVTITREQAACLVAHCFFTSIYPFREELPTYSFLGVFEKAIEPVHVAKIRCFINYFRRIAKEPFPPGEITVTRKVLEEAPDWESSTKTFQECEIVVDGKIEELKDCYHVDFANRVLGGGVLQSGCVQEEILFSINAECIATMLFTEIMLKNESVIISGTIQYSDYKGYARGLQYGGNHADIYQSDIIAIDAVAFFGKKDTQFSEKKILRELNKAYVGFAFLEDGEKSEKEEERKKKKKEEKKKKSKKSKVKNGKRKPIATGAWGCGAFGGDHKLKAVIQLMAAAEAERGLLYCVWKRDRDHITDEELSELYELLRDEKVTVGQVWKALAEFKPSKAQPDLFKYLTECFAKKED